MIFINGYENLGLFALRIALGVIFLYHGLPKVARASEVAQEMGRPGKLMSIFLTFIGIIESASAFMLILGFFTEIASIAIGLIMLGTIFIFKMGKLNIPFSSMRATGWEFDFLILVTAIMLLLVGAGSISLDSLLGFWP